MCKASFRVTFFYDDMRTAKEVLNDAIEAKVRRKTDSDIEIPERKDYNQDNSKCKDTENEVNAYA